MKDDLRENLMSDEVKNIPVLRNEEFIGMWADREAMQDSNEYVRNLRATE